MRYFLICAAVTVGLPTFADEAWVPMTGADIRVALTGRAVTYASAWQAFQVSGRTVYNAASDSWGYWRIEGDQYCSQWPPSDLWACYDMARRGERLRFIGASGDATDATYRE